MSDCGVTDNLKFEAKAILSTCAEIHEQWPIASNDNQIDLRRNETHAIRCALVGGACHRFNDNVLKFSMEDLVAFSRNAPERPFFPPVAFNIH